MSKKTKNYTDSVKELEEIIKKLENNELDIDEMAIHVKKATELIQICKEKLYKTEADVNAIFDEFKKEKAD